MVIKYIGGGARIRTWIPGFGDQSLTVGRHPLNPPYYTKIQHSSLTVKPSCRYNVPQ